MNYMKRTPFHVSFYLMFSSLEPHRAVRDHWCLHGYAISSSLSTYYFSTKPLSKTKEHLITSSLRFRKTRRYGHKIIACPSHSFFRREVISLHFPSRLKQMKSRNTHTQQLRLNSDFRKLLNVEKMWVKAITKYRGVFGLKLKTQSLPVNIVRAE